METSAKIEGSEATIIFTHGKEKLELSFSLESMRTMRFLEASIKAEKTRSEGQQAKAYIELMGRAIKMVGEESFEELEDFYENAGEDLTVTDFISAILLAFSSVEELPKE